MSVYIYLPFNFFNLKKITEEFENYLKVIKTNSLNNLEIKNHTYAHESAKHKELIQKLKNIIEIYKDRFNSKKNIKNLLLLAQLQQL